MERMCVRAKSMAMDPATNKYVRNMNYIRIIHEYLLRAADKGGVPAVANSNVDVSVSTIHETVLSVLRRCAICIALRAACSAVCVYIGPALHTLRSTHEPLSSLQPCRCSCCRSEGSSPCLTGDDARSQLMEAYNVVQRQQSEARKRAHQLQALVSDPAVVTSTLAAASTAGSTAAGATDGESTAQADAQCALRHIGPSEGQPIAAAAPDKTADLSDFFGQSSFDSAAGSMPAAAVPWRRSQSSLRTGGGSELTLAADALRLSGSQAGSRGWDTQPKSESQSSDELQATQAVQPHSVAIAAEVCATMSYR